MSSISGLQLISRDIDNNAAMLQYNRLVDEQRELMSNLVLQHGGNDVTSKPPIAEFSNSHR